METNKVIQEVSSVTGVTVEKILSRDRHSVVTTARFMVYYILWFKCKMTWSEIGRSFDRTHASIIYGVNQAESWFLCQDKKAIENRKRLQKAISNL